MNGLYRGNLNTINTAYGPVAWGHPDLTDVWCSLEYLDDLLRALTHLSPYVRTEQDRLSAHIITERGRVFLHRLDTSPWHPPRANDAKTTLRLLDKLASILKVRALMYSPVARGIANLDFVRADHKEWFARELPPNWGDKDDAVTPNFTRRITDHKQRDWVLHKYDLRAAWPAAARTTLLGFGPVSVVKWDGSRPGLWPVKLRKPVATHAPIIVSGYYDTAIVRAALDAGQDITILPGQGWNSYATCLRSWTERLLRARSTAPGEAATPQDAAWLIASIKAIYTRSGGALASFKQSRAWAYQPHWYYAYRAESARRIWRRVNDLNNPNAAYIIGVDTDTLYTLTPPEMSPYAVFPDAHPDAFNAGRLRYEGSANMTRELFDMLGCAGSELTARLRETRALRMVAREVA
jgi:hypothetical protein